MEETFQCQQGEQGTGKAANAVKGSNLHLPCSNIMSEAAGHTSQLSPPLPGL